MVLNRLFSFSIFSLFIFSLNVFGADVILHFSDFGPPESLSGSATVMKNLQEVQTNNGFVSYLVIPEFDAERFPKYKDPKYVLRLPRESSFQDSENYKKIEAMFKAGDVKAVHVHKEANFSKLGLSLAKAYKVPTILTAHMMVGPFMRDHFANKPKVLKPLFNFIAKKVERDYMKFANSFDIVTVPTNIVRDYLISQGVTRPIMIIPPGGVPVERFTYSLHPDRAYLNQLVDALSDKSNKLNSIAEGTHKGKSVLEAMGAENPARPRKVVVMLARLSTEKGIENVLGAWSKVVENPSIDYQFVLAGLGGINSESERIYEVLKSHPEAGKSIHYVGGLPYDEVPKLLAGGDVVVSASHHETFGLALVEAHAVGRPVVVPDLPAFRTFLKDGENAIFVDKVNAQTLPGALAKIFGDNGDTYIRMSKAARKNAEEFSTDSVNVRTMNSYRTAKGELELAMAAGSLTAEEFFHTPLSKAEICKWVVINMITKQ